MSPTKATLEPAFSDAEREELGHLDYLDRAAGRAAGARADRARGLCDGRRRKPGPPPGDRTGGQLIASAINQARSLAKQQPARCLRMGRVCARAGSIARRGLGLVVALNWDLGDDEQSHRSLRPRGRAISSVSG